VILLASPGRGARWWPWTLTPLTARATGAWLLGIGVAAALAVQQRDLRRVRPAAWGYLVIAVLQAIALARFPHRMDWSSPSGVVYVVVLATMLLTGVTAVVRTTRIIH
jgi:peptidoglycan/LPS O-acetylase OafA/YrhL